MPMKNDGAEIPMILPNIAEVSIQVFCLTAASTPSGIPIMIAMNMAANSEKQSSGQGRHEYRSYISPALVGFPQIWDFYPKLVIAPNENSS